MSQPPPKDWDSPRISAPAGAFLFTDMALSEGAEIELTLRMPSEITLGENMRVRCRGEVLRITKPADKGWKAGC